jgi:hypothetical protein
MRGILLTNGVPRLGGGIRPPTNRTMLAAAAEWRAMEPAEEFLIENGAEVSLYLPNGTMLRICAEQSYTPGQTQ